MYNGLGQRKSKLKAYILQMKSAKIPSTKQTSHSPKTSDNSSKGLSISAPATPSVIQARLKIGEPKDKYEQEADRMADMVVGQRASNDAPDVQRMGDEEEEEMLQASSDRPLHAGPQLQEQLQAKAGKGEGLPAQSRSQMEAVFGADLSQVRVHTGPEAVQMNSTLGARAFTHGNDLYFNQGQYQPGTRQGDHLLAHELTHVIQQGASRQDAPDVQRTIELRAPGRGEASAFDRAGELIARLNAQSAAITYDLAEDGQTLTYEVVDATALTHFDNQMIAFIDSDQMLPMRLVTSATRVGGNAAAGITGVPLLIDSFFHGYVDLDDLMASEDLAFQSMMLHFLTEREVTPRYAQRIGTQSVNSDTVEGGRAFDRGHNAGHEAEAANFRALFNDDSIQFNYDETKERTGNLHVVFKSHDHGYRIFIIINRAFDGTGRRAQSTTGGRVRVRHRNRWFTVEEFMAQRAAAP